MDGLFPPTYFTNIYYKPLMDKIPKQLHSQGNLKSTDFVK